MGNMELWELVEKPPETALRPITGGRLKGKTDINPQWRYKKLTEIFGQCGTGWRYTIDKVWTEKTVHTDEIMCFAIVSLYVFDKELKVWSHAVVGIGGNSIHTKESTGMHANDEGYKMAVTDALSVACKMLGFGSAIYEGRLDGSKYPTEKPQSAVDIAPLKKQLEPYFTTPEQKAWLQKETNPAKLQEAINRATKKSVESTLEMATRIFEGEK
jgi:hypothetical protein